MIAEPWFYMDGAQSSAPITWDRLLELLRTKIISRDTLVRREGSEAWFALGRILSDAALSPPPLLLPISAGDGSTQDLPGAPPAGASDRSEAWSDTTAHPWRRYFARMIDTLIYAALAFFVTGIVLSTTDTPLYDNLINLLSGIEGSVISALLGLIYAMLGGALVIGLTSGSFGKWMMGVRVVDASHRPIGLVRALRREILVWVKGLGLGIPFVTIVTMIMGYRRLAGNAITSWDQEMDLVVLHRPRGTMQTVLGIVGITLFVVTFLALKRLDSAQ